MSMWRNLSPEEAKPLKRQTEDGRAETVRLVSLVAREGLGDQAAIAQAILAAATRRAADPAAPSVYVPSPAQAEIWAERVLRGDLIAVECMPGGRVQLRS